MSFDIFKNNMEKMKIEYLYVYMQLSRVDQVKQTLKILLCSDKRIGQQKINSISEF